MWIEFRGNLEKLKSTNSMAKKRIASIKLRNILQEFDWIRNIDLTYIFIILIEKVFLDHTGIVPT